MSAIDYGAFVLHHGDCREVLRGLADASVDSIVTDPPYHLTTERPGGRSEATRGAVMGGFMGMKWDGGDVAHDVAMWAECLRVLKPGGHMVAFAGTRTYHRMTCAIEDAGFEIRDQIGWAFGSGFPKSHNGAWGGTALKPAWEPICMARKPLIGTVEANWREHGTGALNIDGCRVETDARPLREARRNDESDANRKAYSAGLAGSKAIGDTSLGRWPANLIHDGSNEVLAAFPMTSGGHMKGGTVRAAQDGPGSVCYGTFGGNATQADTFGDSGSAARFFYCAKASRKDRNDGLQDHVSDNTHPTVKPTDLMRYLCRLVTPAGGVVLDPFVGSGSTGRGAVLEGFRFVGIDMSDEYLQIAARRICVAKWGFA